MIRRFGVPTTLVTSAFAAGLAFSGCPLVRRPVTLTSLSPNDYLRVWVIEYPIGLDRNFEVRLENLSTRETRTVFRSPDEGRPVGSERVVWAADGSRFLLLGRHFHTTDAAILPGGESAYLMMDVATGRLWCNARLQSNHPGFDPSDLRGTRWVGWCPDP